MMKIKLLVTGKFSDGIKFGLRYTRSIFQVTPGKRYIRNLTSSIIFFHIILLSSVQLLKCPNMHEEEHCSLMLSIAMIVSIKYKRTSSN